MPNPWPVGRSNSVFTVIWRGVFPMRCFMASFVTGVSAFLLFRDISIV